MIDALITFLLFVASIAVAFVAGRRGGAARHEQTRADTLERMLNADDPDRSDDAVTDRLRDIAKR